MGVAAKILMTRPVICVREDTPVDEVMHVLLRHHISGVPVVDEKDRLVGMISELDLLHMLQEQEQEQIGIKNFVSREVISVPEDASIFEIAEIFLARRVRRLPVVTDGKVVGIISRRDLIRQIHQIRARFAPQPDTSSLRPTAV